MKYLLSSFKYFLETKRYIYKWAMDMKSNIIYKKIEPKLFQHIITPELKQLLTLFKNNKYEIRIAGGAVRDLLMDLKSQDIDFATIATPDQMKNMFNKENIRMINTKGDKHGTITCRINEENFEITTLRIDMKTDGRHAEVEFTQNWMLDALRRDLTINSLFLDFDGIIYDYFGGIKDIENRHVRFVGNPNDRIMEDYLRILRYFRFYGRIAKDENKHDKITLDAIKLNAHGLSSISGERIWVELKKILIGNYATSLFRVMYDFGVANHIGLPLNNYNHCIEEFQKVYIRSKDMQPTPATLMTALYETEEDIYVTQKRLKFSKDELQQMLFIFKHRKHLKYDLNLCQDIFIDSSGKEPKLNERIKELLKYLGEIDCLNEFSKWIPPKFPVSGHSLLEIGVKRGPTLAKMLLILREKWKESRFLYNEEELLDYAKKIKDSTK